MKKMKYVMWFLIVPLMASLILTNCKKDDDDPVPVDFTVLDARITEAQDLHDAAVEGTAIGEYEAGSKAAFQVAIDLATDVRNAAGIQASVDAAVVNLQAAIDGFESKKITEIAPENLIANWLFNGDATDASGNSHDGTLEVGHVNWGGGSVISVEDRFGNADYAYKFEGGGNIVVPQDPSLNPPELTIVTWINLYETWAHSYFLSNDIWNCWKFQVQDANKPFFTRKILKDDGSGENAWIDKDANTGILENGVWTHIAMTYQSGEMIFYINGEETMLWDDFPTGTPVDPNPLVDICIGQSLPTSAFSDVPGDPYEWKEWLGYLKGSLDDLKMYNIVLTGTQVNQIYIWEVANVVE
ncbi:MAG: LamG domain-containing protein [Bacteroidales bacterium]|nr:LamG domain-containing protein [Bacteroidales bacterium]